jgi:hypothetical protein
MAEGDSPALFILDSLLLCLANQVIEDFSRDRQFQRAVSHANHLV